MKKLQNFLDAFTKVVGNIAFGIPAVAELGFVFLTILQITLRLLDLNVLFGLEEIEMVPIFLMYFIGGTLASCDGTHIQCSLVHIIFKNQDTVKRVNFFKSFLYVITGVISAVFSSYHFVYLMKVIKRTTVWHIPSICYEGLIFIGFACMAVFAVIEFLRDILNFCIARSGEKVKEV